MAALRHGVKTLILPKENEKDLAEIDPTVRKALNFIFVEHADSVIETALTLPRTSQRKRKNEAAPVPVPSDHVQPEIRQ